MRCKIVRDIQQRDAEASPFFCLQDVLPGITRIIVRVSSAQAVDSAERPAAVLVQLFGNTR